ncbi:MAG: hypothetical protein V1777_04890 [Candidatus Micrarchaeota archaeon]
MNFKSLAIVGLVLLLAFNASARTINQHVIEITVDSVGKTQVVERFYLLFDSEREITNFQQQAQALGADLDSWQAFDGNIHNYIGAIEQGRITYEEKEGDRFVKLEYTTKNPLFAASETVRQTNYSINSGAFESLRQGSVFVIPSNTKIVIQLPHQTQIDLASLKPGLEQQSLIDQTIQNKRIIWSGHLTISGNLQLNYSIEKEIAPNVGISKLFIQFVQNGQAGYIVAVLLVFLGIVYFKRRSIQQKAEHYLIENSSLEQKNEKEETEIET